MRRGKSAILYLGEQRRLYVGSHTRLRSPNFCLDRVWPKDVKPEEVVDYIRDRNCGSLAIVIERSHTVVCTGNEAGERLDHDSHGSFSTAFDAMAQHPDRFSRFLPISHKEDKVLVCSVDQSAIDEWIHLCERNEMDLRYVDFLDKILFRLFLESFQTNVSALLQFSDILYFGVFSPSESCKVARCFLPENRGSESNAQAENQAAKEVLDEWLQEIPFHGEHDSLVLSDSLCSDELLEHLGSTWNGSMHSFSQVFRDAPVHNDLRAYLSGLVSTLPEYELWVHFRPVFFLRAGVALAALFFLFSLCIPDGGYLAIDNVHEMKKTVHQRFQEHSGEEQALEMIFDDLKDLQEGINSTSSDLQRSKMVEFNDSLANNP